jgi:hypothetical protein
MMVNAMLWKSHSILPPHGSDEHAPVRRPPTFSLLLMIALAAIILVASISALQLLDAAMGGS